MEWQPIETAPKDGTRILVVSGEKGFYTAPGDIGVAHWEKQAFPNGVHEWVAVWCCDQVTTFKPTHWMPLPEPPNPTS